MESLAEVSHCIPKSPLRPQTWESASAPHLPGWAHTIPSAPGSAVGPTSKGLWNPRALFRCPSFHSVRSSPWLLPPHNGSTPQQTQDPLTTTTTSLPCSWKFSAAPQEHHIQHPPAAGRGCPDLPHSSSCPSHTGLSTDL